MSFSALPALNTVDDNSEVVPASIALPVKKSRVEESVSGLANSFGSAYSALETDPLPPNPVLHVAALPPEASPPVIVLQQSDESIFDGEFSANPEVTEPGGFEAAADIDFKDPTDEDSDEPKVDKPRADLAKGDSKRDDSNLDFDNDSPSWRMNLEGNAVWWRQLVHQPIHAPQSPVGVDSNSLVYETLLRSPKIRALSQDPLIRELQIVEADSDFDPVAFVRSQCRSRWRQPISNRRR